MTATRASSPAPAPSDPGSSAPPGPGSSAPSDLDSSAPPTLLTGGELVVVVQGLADARAQAFATADAGPLADAVVPGSPAETADLAAVARLKAENVTYAGLALTVTDAELVEQSEDRAVVSAAVSISPYEQRRGDDVLQQVPALPAATSELTLQWQAGDWRLREVG